MAAPADVVDEHCYARPEWFLDNSRRYDAYPRTGPRVFMGEYAAHPEGVASAASRNIWAGAIAEAAFMVGMERNADIVTMTAYAPLLAHVDAWQWTPDLIWFDNFRAYGTPSYHVQKLFSLERGDVVLPLQVDGAPQADNGQPRFYVCASRDDAAAGEIVLKVVNATGRPVEATIELAGVSAVTGPARLIVLGSDDAKAENSLDHPELVAPVATTIELPGPAFTHTFPASRVVVLRVPVRSQSASSR
jgi:alpha-N-arabinofuranosidase